jgi:hypothetical protein
LISTANQNGAVEPYLSDGFGITIQTGNADGNGDGGMINITAGNAASNSWAAYGGDVTITAGVNTGTIAQNGGIRLNSMVRMPVFATTTARDQAGPQRDSIGWEEGSMCFVSGVGLMIYFNESAWRTVSLVPLT